MRQNQIDEDDRCITKYPVKKQPAKKCQSALKENSQENNETGASTKGKASVKKQLAAGLTTKM